MNTAEIVSAEIVGAVVVIVGALLLAIKKGWVRGGASLNLHIIPPLKRSQGAVEPHAQPLQPRTGDPGPIHLGRAG